jgi:cobalamin biosynthesis protein CobW
MKPKIPATVVTGFLGAGKTSLLRHLIANANGKRLAFIINEFGALGIDREILIGCGEPDCAETDLIELENGCICCTVADDFVPAMRKLLDQPVPPDHIVIETSGLALPKPLVQAFNWPQIKSSVTVDGVIALVDAAALHAGRLTDADVQELPRDHDNPVAELFQDQLACADLVLLNKIDLVDSTTRGDLRALLGRQLRKGVKLIEAEHGAIPAAILLGLSAAAETDLAARPSHHEAEGEDHEHDEFESFVVALDTGMDPAEVAARVSAAAEIHDILRVKGFLAVADKPLRCVLQAVGPRVERYFDRPWESGEERLSRLVVIGLAGLDRAAITATLRGE